MTAKLLNTSALAALIALGSVAAASAEIELSVYGGYQTSPHSRIEGTLPTTGAYSELIGWEGKPFAAPPYYGVRATYWQENNSGWALEWTHAKVYGADDSALFDRLEFTDGLNLITANYAKRWPGQWQNFTPYVSAGIGIALPHVDITPANAADGGRTFEYQQTGAAARLTAGASYALNDNWGLFTEYQFTWSNNKADLNGGGDLKTRIITNSVNVGVSYSF
jgi:lipid A oxidase